jgi:hypothetical protein
VIFRLRELSLLGAVHVHDLQATNLHLLGIDHTRLTDVHGHVVNDLLA